MPGPVPKPARTRQRRNRTSTAATLPLQDNAANEVPALPERENKAECWHPKVLEWWESIWRSPMASEFLNADMRGGLFNLAELYQQRWTAKDATTFVNIVKEIRQQEVRFGLSPIDRRRLQWEVEKGEQAVDRTEKRKSAKSVSGKDPREVLKLAQ